ncbi:hypothetical protein AVEN_11699-1 [Araneus ventricosus]|uniref:PiggyBac transposable element-derived protein domain-containing protein n=1 Tax=Araneus ventricosus TaxID=182803 RepID=A0A4Y2RUE2_ARAVE|nr:hypothetical protein AVEN_94020-1 [Araneus ventricosus]GBN79323.1 hypothetical protein AVEN_11699-1 [Araneus ventricosus]
MARYLTYDEEMKRLRTLLDTVSTEEESLFEDEEEIDDDEEYNSNHHSSTDGDTDIEVDIDSSNENDFYVGRDKITTWKKEKFRTNIRVSAKKYNSETSWKHSYFKRCEYTANLGNF